MEGLWVNWEGVNGSWLRYYRPCIDRIAAIGGNCYKVQAGISASFKGLITPTQHYQRWAQLIRYAGTLEVRVLVNPIQWDWDFGQHVTKAYCQTWMSGMVDYFTAQGDIWPWVLSVDMNNESQSDTCSDGVGTSVYNTMVANANMPSYVPLCTSGGSTLANFGGAGKVCELRNDVLDDHFYLFTTGAPTSAEYDATLGTYYPQYEFMIGEFGTGPTSSGITFYQNMLNFALDPTRPKIRGFSCWSIKDGNHNALFRGATVGGPEFIVPSTYSPIPVLFSYSVAGATLLPPTVVRASAESGAMMWMCTDCTNAFAYTKLYRVTGAGKTTEITPASNIPAYCDDSATWRTQQCGYQASVVNTSAAESAKSAMYVPSRLPRRLTRRRIKPVLH